LATLNCDLHLEVASREDHEALSLEELARLGSFDIRPPVTAILPLPLPQSAPPAEPVVDQVERLGGDAALLMQHTQLLLDQISQRCTSLSFAVPVEDSATRSALLALHLNQDQMTYQNYQDLLQLQINLAQHMSQGTHINEALLGANSQAAVAVTFYEGQLQNTISEASAWALQAKPLIKTQSSAQDINNFLTGYNDYPTNTAVIDAMGGSSQATLAKILEECVPCLERTLSLEGFQPLEALLNLLQSELNRRFNYIQSLWNYLNSNEINLCDLMNYLNTLCIPDLFAILAALSHYWIQLTGLHNIKVSSLLWSLIQPLLQGMLMQFSGLIERFLRLIMAPVQCVITSIDHEYAKLYNLGHASWDAKKGLVATPPYNQNFSKWTRDQVANKVLTGKGPFGTGLLELKKALTNCSGWLDGQIKRLRNAIAESLGVDAGALDDSQGLFLVLRWLSLIIGLIKAIIRFKQDGYQCSPAGLDTSQYQTLVDYLSDATGVPFTIDPTIDPLLPITPSQTPETTDLINQLLDNRTISNPSTTQSSSQTTTDINTYVLPDCVAQRAELERAKVANWITDLDALEG